MFRRATLRLCSTTSPSAATAAAAHNTMHAAHATAQASILTSVAGKDVTNRAAQHTSPKPRSALSAWGNEAEARKIAAKEQEKQVRREDEALKLLMGTSLTEDDDGNMYSGFYRKDGTRGGVSASAEDEPDLDSVPIVSTMKAPMIPVPKPREIRLSDPTPDTPPPRGPTPRWVINLASEHHMGWAVYHDRNQIIAILQALRVSEPEWWDAACDDVLKRMLALRKANNQWAIRERKGAIIVVEGLDGVGKSTVTKALASEKNSVVQKIFKEQKIPGKDDDDKSSSSSSSATSKEDTRIPNAVLVRTPSPTLEAARQKFRSLEDPIARVFYCAANYIAAEEVVANSMEHVVVLDRWWFSTSAMALAIRSKHLISLHDPITQTESNNNYKRAGGAGVASHFVGMWNTVEGKSKVDMEMETMISMLPPVGSETYEWPLDLPPVDLTVLLDCDEDVRVGRMRKRGDENGEERELAEKAALRETAKEAYLRMSPSVEIVQVDNYASAVNQIIDLLDKRGISEAMMPDGKPKRFEESFVKSLKPF